MSHTAGPWKQWREQKADGSRVVNVGNLDGWPVALVFGQMDDANACLIAESPALLAVLKTTVAMLAYEARCHRDSGDKKRQSYVQPLLDQVALATDIIAKAEGSAS